MMIQQFNTFQINKIKPEGIVKASLSHSIEMYSYSDECGIQITQFKGFCKCNVQ